MSFKLWCQEIFRSVCQHPAVYVYVGCCRLYYFYGSLIYGEYLVDVHFGDISHTFIAHFTLHCAEKIRVEFSANYPLTTFRIPQNTPSRFDLVLLLSELIHITFVHFISVTVSYIKMLWIICSLVLSTATGTAVLSQRVYVNMSRH